MKKFLSAVFLFTATTLMVNAQKTSLSKPISFSLGVEGSLPVGDFNKAGYDFGIGGSAQADYRVDDKMALTFNVGYLNYSNKSTAPKYHLSVIPVLGGVKYWFSPKVYGSAQLGAAFNSTKISNSTTNTLTKSTAFAYSPGIGINLTKSVDLLIKYFGNSKSGGTLSSVGARLAYNF